MKLDPGLTSYDWIIWFLALYFTDCWIKGVWKFAYEQNIHITERCAPKIDKSSGDDVMIMDACVEVGYGKAEPHIVSSLA